jgi:hypothetical protein
MRLAGYIARLGRRLNHTRFWWEGNRQLGRPWRKWEDNIFTFLWSDFKRDLDWWLDLLDTFNPQLVTTYHCHTHIQSQVFSIMVFTSLCLVAASNDGYSPYSGTILVHKLQAFNSNGSQKLNLSSSLTNSLTHQPTLHFNCSTALPCTLFNCPAYNTSERIAQKITEISTRNLPGGNGRPARKAENLTAICEPIV